jgi:hypothetical protein
MKAKCYICEREVDRKSANGIICRGGIRYYCKQEDCQIWRFKYDSDGLTITDNLVAASVMTAYKALIEMPIKQRNKVISSIKRAVNK